MLTVLIHSTSRYGAPRQKTLLCCEAVLDRVLCFRQNLIRSIMVSPSHAMLKLRTHYCATNERHEEAQPASLVPSFPG